MLVGHYLKTKSSLRTGARTPLIYLLIFFIPHSTGRTVDELASGGVDKEASPSPDGLQI